MKPKPTTVSWNELERYFNLCSIFCPNQPACDKAVTLQTNYEYEVVSVCGEYPIRRPGDESRRMPIALASLSQTSAQDTKRACTAGNG